MGWRLGRWVWGASWLALAGVACFGGATVPPTPTPPPTIVQAPTVRRPALDTPGALPSVSPLPSVVHIVQAGETLGQIAQRYYGDANRWQQIYDANRAAIPNPNALTVGTRLTIPPR